MNLETKITIYKFTPQLFTLTQFYNQISAKGKKVWYLPKEKMLFILLLKKDFTLIDVYMNKGSADFGSADFLGWQAFF